MMSEIKFDISQMLLSPNRPKTKPEISNILKEQINSSNQSFSIHMESQNWLKERQKYALDRSKSKNRRGKDSKINQRLNSHIKLLSSSNKDNLYYKSTDRLNGKAKSRYMDRSNNISQSSMLEDSKLFWAQTPTNIEIKLKNLCDTD